MRKSFHSNTITYIIISSFDAIGHVNAATGIAQVLIDSGHKVIFAINSQWKGRISKYGIEEVLIAEEHRQTDVDPAKHWSDLFVNGGAIKALTPLETQLNIMTKMMPHFVNDAKRLDIIVEKLLESIRPDVIVMDQVLCVPSVELSNIPYVLTCSFNPLMFIDDDRTPPNGSGLPAKGAENEKKVFRETLEKAVYKTRNEFNDYIVSRGALPLKKNKFFMNDSKYLNIYGFPLEVDYTDVRPLPPNWYRFDNLKRTEKLSNFEIPIELSQRSGKLVYFSLGSMGSADVELMQRLIAILAKSKQRFIVSKGAYHESYALADNMYGEPSVPQIQVLSKVDLVITHGGNNTFTETFYFGKPMIVMPLFGDQCDNAQRLEEKGLGLRLDPYRCTEDELLNAIEQLLNDKELNEKLELIAKRIQSDNSIEKLPKLIEMLIVK